MTTHNTREQDNETTKQMIAEFDEESDGDDLTQKIVGLLGIHGVSVKFEGYTNGSHITNKFVEVFHQELQKARQDWLREEIVRLEGMVEPTQSLYSTADLIHTSSTGLQMERNKGNNKALQTIIDRYKDELDQHIHSRVEIERLDGQLKMVGMKLSTLANGINLTLSQNATADSNKPSLPRYQVTTNIMTDLTKCPQCGGNADNGHDRCDPPNVYFCTKCETSNTQNSVVEAIEKAYQQGKEDAYGEAAKVVNELV